MTVDSDNSANTVSVAKMSRRSFLVTSAVASCGISFVLAGCSERNQGVGSGDKKAQLVTNTWVTLHGDGMIDVISPGIELGQGTLTALALFVAEELDADWKSVRVIAAPTNEKVYGNPLFWNMQIVGGSRTLCGYYDVLRVAGAQARLVLLTAAARDWGVKLDELTTQSSVVSHQSSGRRATYGELVAIAEMPATFPQFVSPEHYPQLADPYFGEPPVSPVAPGPDKVGALSLKPRAQYKLIGVDKPRVDVPAKTNGTARYGMDVQLPDMLYAMVETGAFGSTPETVDAVEARAVPGVVDVLTLPNGVAVLGTTIFAVRDARAKLKVSWRSGSGYDSAATLEDFSRIATRGELGEHGRQVLAQGDAKEVATALSGAKPAGVRRIAFEVQSELVYHAPLEPQNATVRFDPDSKSAEVWVGTQWPMGEAQYAAGILGIKPENVKVNMFFTGGAFGRRSEPGAVIDAAHIARHTRKPVKVIWTREDDLKRNPHRQSLVCRAEAAISEDGTILATRHRVVGDSWLARVFPDLFAGFGKQDPGNWVGATLTYDVPHQVIESWTERGALDVCYLRSVGIPQIKFGQEALIDLIAQETHQDPLQLRIKLAKSHPRGVAVLQEVARMSQWDQWDRKRKDRALGIAYVSYANAHGALVAEVSVDRSTGVIKVHKVWAALDAGLAVQPGNIAAQVEGGIIQGMSIALHERVTVRQGAVQETNFHDYPILRMSEVPDLELKVLSSDVEICGASEIGVAPIAPAINNAVAQLIGKHLTKMPMLPQDVLSALKARPASGAKQTA